MMLAGSDTFVAPWLNLLALQFAVSMAMAFLELPKAQVSESSATYQLGVASNTVRTAVVVTELLVLNIIFRLISRRLYGIKYKSTRYHQVAVQYSLPET